MNRHSSEQPSGWERYSQRAKYVRLAIYGAVLVGYFGWFRSADPPTVLAQGTAAPVTGTPAKDETLEESPGMSGSTSSPRPSPDAADKKVPTSMWDMYVASGAIGYLITLLSVIALGFIVEHFMTIRKMMLMPDPVVEELDGLLEKGELDAAQAFCQEPANVCLFSQVVLAGIERYRGSEFGFAEYKAAVEEAGEEQTSRLYRKTEVLGVIGAIAPMLGLLGTVQGMILGFNMIATTGGAAKPEDLASSISLALVTTFEGLVVAIPAMVAFSFFRNRIDSLVAEAGKRVEQVLAPLGRRRA